MVDAVHPFEIEGSRGLVVRGDVHVPAGSGPHPVVVLVSGSGKQNRDEAFMGL